MKRGFSLIELVLAMAMAALVAVSLFQLLSHTRRTVNRISQVITVDQSLMVFIHQFTKDVTGMFAPPSTIAFFVQQDEQQQSDKKEKEAYIKNVFQMERGGQGLLISFITTGGIQFFDARQTIKVTSWVRRVGYSLQKDPQKPDLYQLMYRVSDNPENPISNSTAYELLSNIKALEVELTMIEVSQDPKTTPDKPVVIQQWNEKEMWDKYKSLIPAYLRFKGILVDTKAGEYPFDLSAKVYAYTPYAQKEKSLFEALEDIASKVFGNGKKNDGK